VMDGWIAGGFVRVVRCKAEVSLSRGGIEAGVMVVLLSSILSSSSSSLSSLLFASRCRPRSRSIL